MLGGLEPSNYTLKVCSADLYTIASWKFRLLSSFCLPLTGKWSRAFRQISEKKTPKLKALRRIKQVSSKGVRPPQNPKMSKINLFHPEPVDSGASSVTSVALHGWWSYYAWFSKNVNDFLQKLLLKKIQPFVGGWNPIQKTRTGFQQSTLPPRIAKGFRLDCWKAITHCLHYDITR